MQLVILDGFTLRDAKTMETLFSDIAEVTAYDRTRPEEVYSRISNADMVLTNKVILSNETLAQCPQIRYVGVLATGYNVIDIAYAKENGITVTNIPSYSTPSVVQHVFALLLALESRVRENAAAVVEGQWCRCPDFTFLAQPIYELAGKTIGIIGMGTIGVAVARVADAFGMRVLAYSRRRKDITYVTWCEQEELFAQADYITLHVPLTEETKELINRRTLSLMKKTAVLINTARGPVVCEQDLADALNRGQIAAAAVDVLSTEPPGEDNPLLTAKNCLITPHIAWATEESKQRLLRICHDNLTAFLAGTPQNVVSR